MRRIAVDEEGRLWVISEENNVFDFNGKSWGHADEIAVGGGSVFILRDTKIYKLDRVEGKWRLMQGKAI